MRKKAKNLGTWQLFPIAVATGLAVIILGLALLAIHAHHMLVLEIQDNTLVETATPSITNEFHSSTDIGWYGSACTFPRTIKLHTHRRPVLLADELPGRRWGHHMFDTVLIWESIRAVPSEMGLYHSCIDPCGCVHRVCRSTQLGCIHRRRGHRWLWRLQHCH